MQRKEILIHGMVEFAVFEERLKKTYSYKHGEPAPEMAVELGFRAAWA